MASWAEFEREAPALAAAIRARYDAHQHSILATLRVDGSPRLCGLETHFHDGELWLAMMPDARKADDLRRDPRFALHSTPDVSLVDGDAKVNGSAVPVDDDATIAKFAASLGQPVPASGMTLFRADLTDASLTRVESDELVIDSWRAGEGSRERRRT